MWQYKILSYTPDETELNALGADGWELVAVYGSSHYFKKPVA